MHYRDAFRDQEFTVSTDINSTRKRKHVKHEGIDLPLSTHAFRTTRLSYYKVTHLLILVLGLGAILQYWQSSSLLSSLNSLSMKASEFTSVFAILTSIVVSTTTKLHLSAISRDMSAATFTSSNIPKPTSWHKFIRGPQTRTIKPVSVVPNTITGNVVHAEEMVRGHGIMTMSNLKKKKKDVIPSVVLDFGSNVVGYLSISFVAASNNTPGIRLAFSETMQFLTDSCDFTRSQNVRIPISCC